MTVETVTTGETIAALILVPLLALVLGTVGVLVFKYWQRNTDDFDRPMFCAMWVVCALGVVACVVGLWWGMYPWKADYHQWRPISGVVATADSRLLGNGQGGMEDKFVVTFEGNPQQYGVLDTRAATVRPGDLLTITCVKRWQWSGTHGFDCNFIDLTRSGK